MKIKTLEADPQHLLIELVPSGEWILGSFGGLLMLLGPITVYLLGWVVVMAIDESGFHHEQSLLQLVWYERKSIPLNDIERFDSEIRKDLIGQTIVVFVQKTDGKKVDLRVGDMSGDDKRALVERLNTSLSSGDKFHNTSDLGAAVAGSSLLGGTLFAAGLFCLSFLQSTLIVGDSKARTICVGKRRRLTPWRVSQTQCIAISNFSHVSIAEFNVRSARGITTSSRYVAIQTLDGQSVPLAHGPMFTDESSQQISEILSEWRSSL
jgi:hypothetical protein